jgi:acyl-CoA thioester hydrolase
MAQAPFRHNHRVTYAECTAGNHVYYARCLDILEAARGEFFRQIGKTFLEWQADDVLFPVIECRVSYKAPARYDDVLTVEVRPESAEGVRLNFSYRVFNQHGQLILEGETRHVCAGLNEKPKRLPVGMAEMFRKFCGHPECAPKA